MFCQVCEESCPVKRKGGQSAIILNHERWKLAGYNREETIEKKLVYQKSKEKSKTNPQEVESNGIN